MLYEPPKIKRYILIGASAVILAVLVVSFLPLLFNNKTTKTPPVNLPMTAKQRKAANSLKKLKKLETSQNLQPPTQEQIQNSLQELQKKEKERALAPSQEQIQKSLDNLSKM
jgi:hypothetical protein